MLNVISGNGEPANKVRCISCEDGYNQSVLSSCQTFFLNNRNLEFDFSKSVEIYKMKMMNSKVVLLLMSLSIQ